MKSMALLQNTDDVRIRKRIFKGEIDGRRSVKKVERWKDAVDKAVR